MGDLPLRTPTHRRFGGPLPRQLPNGTHRHPAPMNLSPPGHGAIRRHPVLNLLSQDYPGARGRFGTRYSPVRRSPAQTDNRLPDAPRLACVKPVASVHPEPGSNSTLYFILVSFLVPSSRPTSRVDIAACAGGPADTIHIRLPSVSLFMECCSKIAFFFRCTGLPRLSECKSTNF